MGDGKRKPVDKSMKNLQPFGRLVEENRKMCLTF